MHYVKIWIIIILELPHGENCQDITCIGKSYFAFKFLIFDISDAMVTTRRQIKLSEAANTSNFPAVSSPSGDVPIDRRMRSLERRGPGRETKLTKSEDTYMEMSDSNGISKHSQAATGTENISDWRKDKGNIALLFILYVLQGIPLGFAGSIPYILMTRKVDYASQALFSFAFYPFSFKLLWAPIVDSVFSRKIGRRKSWLIPIQYLLGLFMLYISFRVNELLGLEEGRAAQINILVFLFTSLNFFAATQDIVVDGWALSMLAPENVGYASTCNSVGQTFGYFISYTVFLAFESKDFCNEYFYPILGMEKQVRFEFSIKKLEYVT